MSFENESVITLHSECYLPKVEIRYYNVKIEGRNIFDQPMNNNIKTYENIRKIVTGQGDDYTTGCLLDYPYFKENYKMTSVDLSKKQALDVDPRAIQRISFTEHLDRERNTCFSSLKKQKKIFLLSTRNCNIIVKYVIE